MKLSNICSFVITYSFYLLFFAVPLFWLPLNSELFEFNKMILVYLLTCVIVGAWILKAIAEKEFKIKRTPLDIPIILFLLANIFSTIFSLDTHTSIFGYYGRWNGGLLSTVAYLLLYYSLASNISKKQTVYYLWAILLSGVSVALYGALQHPNPIFQDKVGSTTIYHGIDYNYWAVDVENRVFSTLGQPNWLAAFLAMIIFPLFSFLLIIKKYWLKFLLFIALTIGYLAFTFTFSRGGTIGLLVGTATFVVLLPIYSETLVRKILNKIPFIDISYFFNRFKNYVGVFLAVLVLVLISNHFFGNALSLRGGVTTQAPISQTQNSKTSAPGPSQLEVGGTQTAKIRTIVWLGSFNIFLHYPILGSGLETFGYSYYLFRPAEHNYTVEWDYLYNKAHNEYINYLATTGAFGFLSYLLLIGFFEFIAVKTLVKSGWTETRFLSLGILAGYNSYLAQNFFGFSVVPIAVLFFLFPLIFFILNDQLTKGEITIFSAKKFSFLNSKLTNKLLGTITFFVFAWLIIIVLSMWVSDFLYNRSTSSDNYQQAISELRVAIKLTPNEPIYQAELATNLAGLASVSKNQTTVKESAKEARVLINKVVAEHPNNTALWQTKRQVDFTLSKVDKANYLELLRSAETLKRLAPTDASIQYDVALVYSFVGEPKKAETQLEEVVKLKNDYQEAILMLARTYKENSKKPEATKLLTAWLKKSPQDSGAQDLLNQLQTK